jgi:uncharacterized protein (UPF0218 family)
MLEIGKAVAMLLLVTSVVTSCQPIDSGGSIGSKAEKVNQEANTMSNEIVDETVEMNKTKILAQVDIEEDFAEQTAVEMRKIGATAFQTVTGGKTEEGYYVLIIADEKGDKYEVVLSVDGILWTIYAEGGTGDLLYRAAFAE